MPYGPPRPPGYLSGSFVAAFNNAGVTTPTLAFEWVLAGKIVTLCAASLIPNFTSDSTQFAETVASVPAEIRPVGNDVECPWLLASNNGVDVIAAMQVRTNGTLRFGIVNPATAQIGFGSWNSSGLKAIRQRVFASWSIP